MKAIKMGLEHFPKWLNRSHLRARVFEIALQNFVSTQVIHRVVNVIGKCSSGADLSDPNWYYKAELGDDLWRDHEIVEGLMCGRIKVVNGRKVHEYLSGREERDAFTVLARLLRSDQLHRHYRLALANLFEPDIQEGIGRESRRLAFVFRKPRGRKRNKFELRIALDLAIASLEGQHLKQAIAGAMKGYGVSERTVTRAWQELKKDSTMGWIARRATRRPSKLSK
jgi:hypothetical protein